MKHLNGHDGSCGGKLWAPSRYSMVFAQCAARCFTGTSTSTARSTTRRWGPRSTTMALSYHLTQMAASKFTLNHRFYCATRPSFSRKKRQQRSNMILKRTDCFCLTVWHRRGCVRDKATMLRLPHGFTASTAASAIFRMGRSKKVIFRIETKPVNH